MNSAFELASNFIRPTVGFLAGYGLTTITGTLSTTIYRRSISERGQTTSSSLHRGKPRIDPVLGLISSTAIAALAANYKMQSCQLGALFMGNLCVFVLGHSKAISQEEIFMAIALDGVLLFIANEVNSIALNTLGSQIPYAEVIAGLSGTAVSYASFYIMGKLPDILDVIL